MPVCQHLHSLANLPTIYRRILVFAWFDVDDYTRYLILRIAHIVHIPTISRVHRLLAEILQLVRLLARLLIW